jgi:VanZ family protein
MSARLSVRLLSLWTPVAIYMALIFLQSSLPIRDEIRLMPDWLLHGVGYGGLALVALRATSAGRWARVGRGAVLAAWLIASVYGLSDEWHQSFVPGRTSDVGDAAANAVGALIAVAGAWAWGIIRRRS